MKPLLTVAVATLATPALAHLDSVPHVHGSDGALWGIGLILAAAVLAGLARR